MTSHIFHAQLKYNNVLLSGPVTTQDNTEFLFVNRGSDVDLYFSIKKNEQFIWYVSNGPSSYQIPDDLVQQLGNLVDFYKTDKKTINDFADGLLYKFIPKDKSVRSLSFDFLLLPNLNLRVYYTKVVNDQGQEIWEFTNSHLLQ